MYTYKHISIYPSRGRFLLPENYVSCAPEIGLNYVSYATEVALDYVSSATEVD